MDCSLPGSCLHGILQARILEWVAIFFSRGSSRLRDRTQVSCTAGRCFNLWATREALKVSQWDWKFQPSNHLACSLGNQSASLGGVLCCAKSLSWVQLFATLNCSAPGPSVRGILPARILEWVAMLFSRGSSQVRDWMCASKVSWQVGSVSLAPSRWGPKAT